MYLSMNFTIVLAQGSAGWRYSGAKFRIWKCLRAAVLVSVFALHFKPQNTYITFEFPVNFTEDLFFFFCSSLQNSGISSVSFQFQSTCSGAAILRFGAAELPFEGRIPLKIKRCSGAADLPFEGRSGPRGHVLPTPELNSKYSKTFKIKLYFQQKF